MRKEKLLKNDKNLTIITEAEILMKLFVGCLMFIYVHNITFLHISEPYSDVGEANLKLRTLCMFSAYR